MANIRYNVNCPTCEASIPIRSSSMIGKKTECPKCKFKFVVPEPPDEDGDAPKKGKKAAKKSNKTLIYAGAGVGALAVVLLVVAGVFLMGGDEKPASNAATNPVAAKPMTSGSTTPAPAVSASTDGNPGAAGGPTPPPPPPKPNGKLKDVTNLLPNETTAVYRVNFDRLNSHATPLANALFDTKMKDLFRNSMTFGVDNLATYVHCVVGPDRDTFGVFRTKSPFDVTAFLNSLKDGKLPNGVKRGNEMFLLKSNAFVDAVSQAFATRTLTKMAGLELPPLSPADRDAAAKKQYGVCVLDTQTLVLGDLVTLERYLDDLSDSGFPPFKSEMTTEQPPPPPTPAAGGPGGMIPGMPVRPMVGPPSRGPGAKVPAVTRMQTPPPMMPGPTNPPGSPMPGAGGASSATPRPGPQRRLFTTVPTYRTIDPPLKKMLNLLEENENDPPAVVYAEKLDQRVFGGRQFQQLFQQTGSSVAGLLARVQMVGGIVNQVTQEKANVEIALEFVSDDDAKKTVAEAILPGLKLVTPLIDLAMGTRTLVKDNTASGQGGNPMGTGGPEGNPMSPGSPYPGSSGSPSPSNPSAGSPSAGSPYPGSPYPGTPGGNPADSAGGAANSGLVEISLSDRLLTVAGTMKWPEEKYRTLVAPQITRVSSMMKGRMSVLTGEIEWHRLAAVSAKLQDGKKPYPRGTLDREASDTRYRLAYPPEQRCSFFVDLLPYIGQGPLRNQIQDKKFPWYAKENVSAGEAWVPEFLVPYYPQESWRATHPLAPGRSLGATNYVAPAGLGMDAGYYDPADAELAKKVGITGYSWGSKPEDVKDGLSNTIYLLQVAPGTARPWVAGGGATNVGIDESNPMAAFAHRLPDGRRGTYALMADGSVRFLKEGTDPKLFMALVTRAGGESLTDFDKSAPKVEPTKALDTELRGGAAAGKPLPVKEAEINLEEMKPFQGTWNATFFKSQKTKGLAKEVVEQVKVEMAFDGKLIRTKVTGLGKEPASAAPDEVVKIDAAGKTMDIRDEKGTLHLARFEFRGEDKVTIRTSEKARPAKTSVPEDKSEDDYVELERVK